MKAALGALPPDDDSWAYEVKYDGYRTLAFVDHGSVRLQSTNCRDVTDGYPELGELPSGVHADVAVLDGEFVVLDDDGRPRFELVQRHERPGALYLFDVLRIGEHDTIGLPYEDRRRLLEQLVEPGDHWLVPAHRVGDGAALLAATAEQELEGVMAKRLGSTYVPGKRSPNWRKMKNRRRIDVVIGGFTHGDGNRASTFGSLLVGRRTGDSARVRRRRRHGVRPADAGVAAPPTRRPDDGGVPVRAGTPRRLPTARDLGRAGAVGGDRDGRIHERRPGPTRQFRGTDRMTNR